MKDGRLNDAVAAILLAAGFSSRMGMFKPLMKIGEKSAVDQAIGSFMEAGIKEIILVTGYRAELLVASLESKPVKTVFNPEYESGMVSSVKRGVEALSSTVQAFFLLPVDIPLVKPQTLQRLITCFQETGAPLVYPVMNGLRGHPPLIAAGYRQGILEHGEPGGLRSFLEKREQEARACSVADQGVLMDMDTRQDYEALCCYHEHRHTPTQRECRAILDQYHVSSEIRAHGEMVAKVACLIGRLLKEKQYFLDIELLRAAGLLHDLAKGSRRHDLVGGKLLADLGFNRLGAMVASHMEIQVDGQAALTEAEVLYLADKLVNQEQMVSLTEQQRLSSLKYAHDPVVLSRIRGRIRQARLILDKVLALLKVSEEGLLQFQGERCCL